jgi:5-methylcytosine-specific restriction endonuclease McrA
METKRCSNCKQDIPATSEYFSKNKDGFSNYCRTCANECVRQYRKTHKAEIAKYREDTKEHKSEQSKKYYIENKEAITIRNKKYHELNKEHFSEYKKEWKIINKDRILEVDKKYYEANREILLEKGKQYYEANKEQFAIQHRRYYENNLELVKGFRRVYRINNPDVARKMTQRRRAKACLLPCTLTVEQWEVIKHSFDEKCAYCGKELPLEQEHFVPLVSGGEYTHNNIIPACRSCNSSKGAKDFFQWYPKYRYFSKKRKKEILNYLGYRDGVQQLALAF